MVFFPQNRSSAIFLIPKVASTQDMKFIVVAFHLLEIRMWQFLKQHMHFLTEKLCLPTFPSHKLQSQRVKQTVLVLRSTTQNDFMTSILILTLDLPTSRSLSLTWFLVDAVSCQLCVPVLEESRSYLLKELQMQVSCHENGEGSAGH